MLDSRFALNVHILSLLDSELPVTSEQIASSTNVNPALIRKELGRLRKNGLIITKEGKNGGSELNVSLKELTLSEIYKSTYDKPLFSQNKNKPKEGCPIGAKISNIIEEINIAAEEALINKLGSITLDSFIHNDCPNRKKD